MKLLIKQLEIQQTITSGKDCTYVNFAQLAEKAWLWRIQYTAQCAHLIAHLNQPDININAEKTQEILKTTLFMTELLEALYAHLNETSNQVALSENANILKHLLKQPADTPVFQPLEIQNITQRSTFHTDTIRLLNGNLQRIAFGLLAFPAVFHDVTWLKQITRISGPILSFAGFLIYIPRSIVNSIILATRYLEQQLIPLKSRLLAHAEINDRVFNLINDFPSILAGFISVFLLVTSTLWLGVYLTVAVKLFEVCFSAARSYYDISRLHTMRLQYDQYDTNNLSSEDLLYLEQLDAVIAYTESTRHANTLMHSLLLVCLSAFIPAFMLLHPVVPLFAASFAFCVICHRMPVLRDLWIRTPAPQANLGALKHDPRFFQAPTEEAASNSDLDLTSYVPPVSILDQSNRV
jgi:hypothetical protein